MNSKYFNLVLVSVLFLLCIGCTSQSALIWRGDFETADLSQWSYLLNPQGLALEHQCVYEGRYAGRVTLSGELDMLWHGNEHLNRVEYNHKPDPGRVDEGKDTFFGWSFYLEKPLSATRHELGYWESDNSYQQMFRFNIVGEDLSFQETASNEPFWVKEGFAAPGVWHDVAMHIHWSMNAQQGFVRLWLDGEAMEQRNFQTLHETGEDMFTQIGILRDRQELVESLLLDNVREGKSIDAVLNQFDPTKKYTCQHE